MVSLKSLEQSTQGLYDLKLTTVDSNQFIQSQKEYSMCLIAEKNYSKEELEDMSYFHFLSSKSMIFDLVGQSNFQYAEAKALGVGLVPFDDLLQSELEWALRRIHGALKDL